MFNTFRFSFGPWNIHEGAGRIGAMSSRMDTHTIGRSPSARPSNSLGGNGTARHGAIQWAPAATSSALAITAIPPRRGTGR
jgi:hypothetical protein